MISEKDKLLKFVAKLIELTQEKKMNWSLKNPRPPLISDPDFAGTVFAAEFKSSFLGLYRRKEKFAKGFGVGVVASVLASQLYGDIQKEWRWVTILEITDYANNCLWTFPKISGLDDLYNAVEYFVSGVGDLIDSVLREEEEKSS
jgi:hypothetical protein